MLARCLTILLALLSSACSNLHEARGGSAPAGQRALEARLAAGVERLAGDIGERHCYRPAKLEAAARWIEAEFQAAGYAARRQPVPVPASGGWQLPAMTVHNIEAVKLGHGRPDEVIVIGAHYDTKVASAVWSDDASEPLLDQPGTPGADDNASGTATVVELARLLRDVPTERTIRFVAFVNEEPPFFQSDSMGSLVYARALAREDVRVIGMIAAEMLGCWEVAEDNHKRIAAAGLVGLPDRADYLAFLSSLNSSDFADDCARRFVEHCTMPVRCVAFPALSERVAWSDDWAFWQAGFPAFAATDTAYLRNPHYHELTDTPDRLDYATMAEVVRGLAGMLVDLAGGEVGAIHLSP